MIGRPPFNASVHGARGLFALMVFGFHVANSGLPTFWPADSVIQTVAFASLKFGVELFFGISGFVIVGALGRAPSIRSFLWDRATRIYPLLWFTLLAITAISLAVGHWLPPWSDWALNFLAPPPFLALPQVNPAAWSLGYETGFYVLAALCWRRACRGDRSWVPVAVVTGLVLVALLPRAVLMPIGVLVAAGWLDGRAAVRTAAFPGLSLLGFLIVWRLVELHAPGGDIAAFTPARVGPRDWLVHLPLLLAGAALGGMALRGIVAERGLLCRALRHRLLQWLGTNSFSFYLIQPIVMSVAKSLLVASGVAAAAGSGAQLAFALVALPPTLMAAHVSQRWIELRLTRRLRALGPSESRPHPPITVAADHLAPVGREA